MLLRNVLTPFFDDDVDILCFLTEIDLFNLCVALVLLKLSTKSFPCKNVADPE